MIQEPDQQTVSPIHMEPIPESNGPTGHLLDTHVPHLEPEQLDVKPELNILVPEEDVKIKISTSPASSPTLMQGPNSSVSRRSTRKSTLTQQQKNSRRQRATADQLTLLEVEFNNNPTPTATVRERIAQDINMTERSVQIWFQNRRAKIKNLAKKSAETGEDCDAIPESMRRYLAMQALESGKSFSGAELFVNGALSPFPGGGPMMDSDGQAPKLTIHHLNCRSLSIGSWRRIGQTQLDLVVFYCPTKSLMTYYIQAENTGFRIEYPFSAIKDMTLDTGDVSASAEGASQQSASIVIELHHPPIFTMDQGTQGWFQCRDFTEDHQASQVLVHHLGGHAKILSSQMAKLVSLDAYRMRHNYSYDSSAVMSSAPVSPTLANRPASQPNHLVHPHMQVNFQAPMNFNMGPPAPPRGHKRQRSRSVPVAIDFSQRRLNQPLPDFMVHHQHQHHHVHHHNPNPQTPNPQNHIFAPVPQHVAQLPYHSPPIFGSVPHELNVDTGAGFHFDFVPPAPLSATTATTPPSSEFESAIFTQKGHMPDSLSAPQAHTPYNGPFLSPLVDSSSLLDPSVSPLSAMSHHDQQGYDETPQYIYRSASADPALYQNQSKDSEFDSDALIPREKPMVYDAESFFDDKTTLDALLLEDPFSKQPLTLPFRGPLDDLQQLQSIPQDLEHQIQAPRSRPVSDDFEFSHLIHLDPTSLSPEHEKPAFLA